MRQRTLVVAEGNAAEFLIVFLSLGGFALIGVIMGVVGVVAAILEPSAFVPGLFFAVIGFAAAPPLGWWLSGGLWDLRTKTLILDDAGFQVTGHVVPWADVDGFEPASDTMSGHVRVRFVPGVPLDRRKRLSMALGRLRLFTPLAYLPTHFETGGRPLIDVLSEELWRYRNPEDEIDVHDAAPLEDPPDPEDELVVPLKRRRAFTEFLICLAFVALVAGVIVGPWLARINDDFDRADLVLGVASAVLFLAVLTPLGAVLVHLARKLGSGGLRLDGSGFEYRKHRWRWADLESIEPGIRVTYRAECVVISAPSETGIDPDDFETDGEPLVDLLQQWLARAQNNAN
ncbi:MAG: hypothetical protein ACSLE6_01885 [Mycobacterium sp.]